MDFKGPAACKKQSTKEMRAVVLGATALSRDTHLPYVSLLLAGCGPFSDILDGYLVFLIPMEGKR